MPLLGLHEFEAGLLAGLAKIEESARRDIRDLADKTRDDIYNNLLAIDDDAPEEAVIVVEEPGGKVNIEAHEMNEREDEAISAYIEFGTSHSAPMPFMRPALAEVPAKAESSFRKL